MWEDRRCHITTNALCAGQFNRIRRRLEGTGACHLIFWNLWAPKATKKLDACAELCAVRLPDRKRCLYTLAALKDKSSHARKMKLHNKRRTIPAESSLHLLVTLAVRTWWTIHWQLGIIFCCLPANRTATTEFF